MLAQFLLERFSQDIVVEGMKNRLIFFLAPYQPYLLDKISIKVLLYI